MTGNNIKRKIIVIGAGAAGMMAAYYAKDENSEVYLIDQNEKCGRKLYITGKGRCNVVNKTSREEILANVVNNSKFLYAASNAFSAEDIIEFFEKRSCPIKIERGNRAFPTSDKASDIIKCLQLACEKKGVKILLNTKIVDIKLCSNKVEAIYDNNLKEYTADAYIFACGGLSYPKTGSDGKLMLDFAKKLNIKLIEPYPALVPINCTDHFIKSLMGLSLKNVELSLYKGKKVIYYERGEMLFTHFGISGPMVLSASSYAKGKDLSDYSLSINLKPALDRQMLSNRIIREVQNNSQKNMLSIANLLFPSRLAEVVLERVNIDKNQKASTLSKKQRENLVDCIHNFKLHISSKRDFNEAIVSGGGWSVKDFNPSTMQNKNITNLYACGEMLDLDALTGGFNLYIAFSTARLAGLSANKKE